MISRPPRACSDGALRAAPSRCGGARTARLAAAGARRFRRRARRLRAAAERRAAGAASQAIALACLAQVQASSDRLRTGAVIAGGLSGAAGSRRRHSRLLAHGARRAARARQPAGSCDRRLRRGAHASACERCDSRHAGRCAGGARRAARGARIAGCRTAGAGAAGAARCLRTGRRARRRCARRPRPGSSSRPRAAIRIHQREAALLALDGGDASQALRAARANFQQQKELADVRLLARAAVAASDADARRQLADWLRSTGYRDAVTEEILAGAARG